MTQPESFMPDDLIRTRNWADLTAEEKLALKDVAATEEEFRLLKLMLNTATEPTEDIPEISPAVHERLKTAFQVQHQPRGKVIGWWKYAAAAAVAAAIAGTIWIMNSKNKKETEIARDEPKKIQPITPKDTVPAVQQVKDTLFKPVLPPSRDPRIRPRPIKPVDPPVQQVQQLPAIDQEQPVIAANINTSVKENSELLGLVTAVY